MRFALLLYVIFPPPIALTRQGPDFSDKSVDIAYQKVLRGEFDWAMFGYKGKKRIKLVDAGGGGVEALSKQMVDKEDRVLYVVLRSSNSPSAKFILLTWVGDKAPPLQKGRAIKNKRAVKGNFPVSKI